MFSLSACIDLSVSKRTTVKIKIYIPPPSNSLLQQPNTTILVASNTLIVYFGHFPVLLLLWVSFRPIPSGEGGKWKNRKSFQTYWQWKSKSERASKRVPRSRILNRRIRFIYFVLSNAQIRMCISEYILFPRASGFEKLFLFAYPYTHNHSRDGGRRKRISKFSDQIYYIFISGWLSQSDDDNNNNGLCFTRSFLCCCSYFVLFFFGCFT